MNLDIKYWYYESVIPEVFCEHLIDRAKQENENLGTIGTIENKNLNEENLKVLKKKRNSHVAWLEDPWIYHEIIPFVHNANINAKWNFEWDHTETSQFTKYNSGQYYGWHCDSWEKVYSKEKGYNYEGKIRKLSTVCSLSDPSEYEGGEFEFQFRNSDDPNQIFKVKEIVKKGSIIVFPSFLWHRVKPVIKGTRYSLVMWHLGRPFK